MAIVKHLKSISRGHRLTMPVIEELGIRGLHCGCGSIYLKGEWCNTDLAKLSDGQGNESQSGEIVMVNDEWYYMEHDVATAFPFDDEVFDWIYSEHFIEHITPRQATFWLKEARRMLKPGGVVRISTPNMRKYMDINYETPALFFREHHSRLIDLLQETFRDLDNLSPIQEQGVIGALTLVDPGMELSYYQRMKDDPAFRSLAIENLEKLSSRPAFMINQIFYLWGHKWIYDFDEVGLIAQRAGFEAPNVKECSFRQGEVEALCKLDLPSRNDESLYVEIHKG